MHLDPTGLGEPWPLLTCPLIDMSERIAAEARVGEVGTDVVPRSDCPGVTYGVQVPELVTPTSRLHGSWLDSRDEWGLGFHQDGAGLSEDDDVDTSSGFSNWVTRLLGESDTSTPPEPGRVHATNRWIVEDGTYLGAIQLRHTLTDSLLEAGGHIGYGIRPSARRRGYASWALRAVLPEARALGMDSVLITCDDDNIGSMRTIERSGAVLEDVRETEVGRKRRYWITL